MKVIERYFKAVLYQAERKKVEHRAIQEKKLQLINDKHSLNLKKTNVVVKFLITPAK